MSVVSIILSYWWIVLLAFVVYRIWDKRARFHPTLPAPGAKPLVGMLPTYSKRWNTIHDWWYECHIANNWKTFQQPTPFLKTRSTTVITCDPANLKHVLKDNFDNYIKGPNFTSAFYDLLGAGIFNVNGDEWRQQRKIASHMFSLTRLRQDMSTVFTRNSEVLINLIDTWSHNKQSFDIQDLFFRFTLESFTEIAFGDTPGALSMKPTSFATAFDIVQRITNARATSPLWVYKKWFNMGSEYELAKNLKIINEYAYGMITKRRHSSDCNTRHDLLSLFFQQKEETDSEQLSDKYLRDIILNFMIAGRDTTATLMSWCIYEIIQHPEVEEKLMKELYQAYEYKQPSYDATTLPYLQAFIYETLRLHPSVPLDGKTALKPDILPDGTKINAFSQLWFCPYSMGRHPGIWGSDALLFRPERWLERDTYPTSYEFPHFLGGPRLCLGKNVAIMQASLVLSTILLKFRLSLVPGQRVTYQVTATMPILNGLHVTATPR